MEIYKTKNFNVLFTGSHYYFTTDCSGLFAIAERDYQKQDNNECHFSLLYGNEHLRPNWCNETAKRFIRKAEQKYVPNKSFFDSEDYEELNRTRYIDISAPVRR